VYRNLSRLSVAGLLVSVVLVGSPALADDTSTPTTSTVVATESVTPSEFAGVSATTEDEVASDVANASAEMGVMVDASAIEVRDAPGVGTVAGTATSLDAVSGVGLVESAVTQGDQQVAEDYEYSMDTNTPPNQGDGDPLPVGPGSLGVRFYPSEPCSFLYGSDRGNYMTACETLGYLDGGDGRRFYGAADDDGSRYYDWFTYHQWGTVHPSDSGLDWIITSGSKKSMITATSINSGSPGVTDYAPNSSSCDGALTMGAGFVFNFSGELCSSGTEIDFPDSSGSFSQKLNIGFLAPDNSKGLNYRVAIRIKQHILPAWYTINKATFRKQFSTSTNSINDVT
jgi:hypothetical protein